MAAMNPIRRRMFEGTEPMGVHSPSAGVNV